MRVDRAILKSAQNIEQSVTRYESVSLSADYEPDTPFKGLYITSGGDVTIVGLDGVAVTMTLQSNTLYPFGGSAILISTTSADGIFALR